MNDKSNILASLMTPQTRGANKENESLGDDGCQLGSKCNGTSRLIKPTSGSQQHGSSNKQHKLKQRFTVIRKLGKGTYGKVQLAINKETGQEVAIKTIKKTKIENEQDLQRVRREIQIMSSIEHPHIIHIYEVFENKDKIVLVMQYAPGGELYEYVSQSKLLDDSEARRLFRQIATAIYYCHKNKICHRDLKLENILLDEKNNAKLADFGLSNVFDKSHQLRTFCGSPLYASPEIVQGSPYEGPEVDCWSLGVLLYTLVYGAMPFDGSNFKRLVKQISESCYFEPREKSQASPLIRKLLCADPKKRATILDICSDPWVNGTTTVPSNGQFQSPTSSHQSLLKVAQDMANLTPVRFDILLALTPQVANTEQAAAESQSLAARPPLATRSDQNKSRAEADSTSARRASVNLGPSIMELEEEHRATSPVASYIVRDLEAEEDQQPTCMVTSDDKLALEQSSSEWEEVQGGAKALEDGIEAEQEKMDESELEQPIQVEAQFEQQANEIQIEAAHLENKVEHSIGETDPTGLTDTQQKQEEEERAEDTVDIKTTAIELGNGAAVQSSSNADGSHEEGVKMDIDELKETEVAEKIVGDSSEKYAQGEESAPGTTGQQEKGEDQLPEVAVSVGEQKAQEDKPKKVKKKVVVVKKRKKRVANKDGEEPSANKDEDKSNADKDIAIGPDGQDSKKMDTSSTPKLAKTKPATEGPGKVRIPDTFQPQQEENAPQAPASKAEGRRQSSLVADVSQKLLQQSGSTNSNTTNLIRTDQPQLASVRVSDKKSEFERRASLAATSPTPSKSPTSSRHQPELYQAQLLPLEAGDEQLTIVEPVRKLEPKEAPSSLQLPTREATDEAESESQTPTYQRQAGGHLADVRQRLVDCANKLGGHQQPNEHQPAEDNEATGNDRSDSVETIKAAAAASPVMVEAPPSVRSQFSIQLGEQVAAPGAGPGAVVPETPTTRSLATGPAPITRSYKKVTFTRDGACITETGKIYSTQADDGTVRRIERKSKVTHYPVAGGGLLGDGRPTGEAMRSERVEEEEEVIEGDGVRGSVWQEHHQSSASSFHQSGEGGAAHRKPLERLIMPTNDESNLFGPLEHEFGFASAGDRLASRPPSFAGRERAHSRQLGRADSSCSSCSSGSTDVFDDIFDHWTGAISMFNQGAAMGGHFRPLSGRTPTRGPSGRRTPAGGSLAGTPRCESAEPPPSDGPAGGHLHNRRRRHREWRSPGANTSGYESDAASERPATAMGGSGMVRGSMSRLFPSLDSARRRLDPFFADTDHLFESHLEPADDLRRTIAQEHDNLRRRLAQQHKQLWKGSTPSLFAVDDDFSVEPLPMARPTAQFHRQPVPMPSSIGQMLRGQSQPAAAEEASGGSWAPSSGRGHQRPPRLPPKSYGSSSALHKQQIHEHHVQQQQTTTATTTSISQNQKQAQAWPRENLEQSQSTSSFLCQSVALASAPNRRDQAAEVNLPPRHEFHQQTMRRSTSKISLLGGDRLPAEAAAASSKSQQQQSVKHQTASFIELKRTSSSSSTLQQDEQQLRQVMISRRQQQQQVEQQSATGATTQRVISNSGSSSAHWESVAAPTTPLSCATLSGGPLETTDTNGKLARENLDSRVQSWLQESTGNLSGTSSGSKSSLSEQSRQPEAVARARPATSARSPVVGQKEVSQSASSTVMISSTSSSSATNWAAEQRNQLESTSLRNTTIDAGAQSSASGRLVTTKATFNLRQSPVPKSAEVDGGSSSSSYMVKQQQVSTSSQCSSMTNVRRLINTTPTCNPRDGPIWTHESSSRSIFGEELDESLSGGCSAELESRSSSSLLDQLRSRGYRSMINQRMVSGNTIALEQPTIQGQVSSSFSAQLNRQEQASSSSRVVISSTSSSSNSTRLVQQHKQVTVSNSSSANQIKSRTTVVEQGDDDDEAAATTTTTTTAAADASNSNCVIQQGDESEKDASLVTGSENRFVEPVPGEATSSQRQDHDGFIDRETAQTGEENDPQAQDKEVDEDEDVREAKASIKAQLDRVKETEMFLKSLHAEEAEAEQKRQQLFLFNNLMLSTKLNGYKTRQLPLDGDSSQLDALPTMAPSFATNLHSTGPLSAPVYMAPSFGLTPFENCPPFMSNGFTPAQPYSAKSYLPADELDTCDSFESPSSGFATRKLQHKPLESLSAKSRLYWPSTTLNGGHDSANQPMATSYSYQSEPSYGANGSISGSRVFRRSRSQLSEQFGGISANRRPISENLDHCGGYMSQRSPYDWSYTQNTAYLPSSSSRSRRSVSQIRQHSATATSSFHYASGQQMGDSPSSGHASPRATTRRHWAPATNGLETTGGMLRDASAKELSRSRPVPVGDDDDDDDDDHGLGSYRVSAYVPKVVPQGMPTRGRSSCRRRNDLSASDWTMDRTERSYKADLDTRRGSTGGGGEDDDLKRVRRVSLQELDRASSELRKADASPFLARNSSPARKISPSYKRRSLTTSLVDNQHQSGSSQTAERSRLSELEQRIMENKRRREELLAVKLTDEPEQQTGPEIKAKKRDKESRGEALPAESKAIKLNARPSRLESMEARIKRRSFYVRTSPERSQIRGQQNRDKWRRPSDVGRRGTDSEH